MVWAEQQQCGRPREPAAAHVSGDGQTDKQIDIAITYSPTLLRQGLINPLIATLKLQSNRPSL